MNISFLVITLVVVLVATGFWVLVVRGWGSTQEGVGLIGGMLFSAASLVMLCTSLIAASGTPTITETTSFSVEKTPYRLIVKAFDREVTFTDAYTVANADSVERVRLTVQHNAWGSTLESGVNGPKLTLLFKGSNP